MFFNLRTRICLALFCSVSMSAHANIITVTNTNDGGPGSLRQALADANDSDTINFAVTGTIGLTSAELLVTKSISISGPGADILAVNGNATYRVFHIAPGKIVAISDLTITNGNATKQPVPDGGGIYNDHATLTLTDCTISNNSAFRDAGGIYNGHAMLTLTNCTISGNLTGNDGGGVNNDASFGSSATLQVSNTVIINNSAYHGGGVCNDARLGEIAMLQIGNSTLSNNHAGYDAGAVLSIGDFGHATATFSNCTISDNSAQAYGGGINCTVTDIPLRQKDHLNRKTWPAIQRYTGNPAVTIVNVTISGNAAGTIGGGIYDHALVGIANTTFSGNSAVSGGGIYHDGGMPPLAVEFSDTVLNAGASGGKYLQQWRYRHFTWLQSQQRRWRRVLKWPGRPGKYQSGARSFTGQWRTDIHSRAVPG